MEVIVKQGTERVDVRHPENTEEHQLAAVKAERMWPTMEKEFKSEGEKSDYLRRVRSNPNNLPGMPCFFPPLKIQSNMNNARPATECECGGCCTYLDSYICPRCGTQNLPT